MTGINPDTCSLQVRGVGAPAIQGPRGEGGQVESCPSHPYLLSASLPGEVPQVNLLNFLVGLLLLKHIKRDVLSH